MELNELSEKSNGGTELMGRRLYASIDPDLLSNFQIILSRVRYLDKDKIRVLWFHDLADDPENDHLLNEGWRKFHFFVFVSYWQMYSYIDKYKIPHSMCVVIRNGIEPFPKHTKPTEGPLNLVYFSTPHRGLNILVPVFEKLVEEGHDIHLHVYSSFELYGWAVRDIPFAKLFDRCKEHPKITYGGAISNEEMRAKLEDMHILAFPSTWPETSCLVLIEAMVAGLDCVHSDFGALPETSSGLTHMYRYDDDVTKHARNFYGALKSTIENYRDPPSVNARQMTSLIASEKYNWDYRAQEWNIVLEQLLKSNPPREIVESTNNWNYTVKI